MSTTRLRRDRFSSLVLQFGLQLDEAARDPARDRARRKIQSLADVPVALVAGEEAVEDLLAVVRKRGERVVDVQGLVELGDCVIRAGRLGKLLGRLAGAGTNRVETQAARHLREP